MSFRLVVDLSKAGRPAPQKKARAKANPFQTATVSESNSGAPKLLSSSFGARQTVPNPLQIEMVFAFARASFVVLAALRSTDRGGVEKDIF